MTNASTKILSLDGGGAKGFYTLGALREIEAMLGSKPLCESFRLIFGTSTGSIIAALLALGHKVDEIHELYRTHVPRITRPRSAQAKSAALSALATEVFGEKKFDVVKTGIGIVATRWVIERPMIFKAAIDQAHGRTATFVPGFGCTIAHAVEASCSAYPFFNRKMIRTAAGHNVELVDGGYCANNPTLYAIADALIALKVPPDTLRVVSVGVGAYPTPKVPVYSKAVPGSFRLGAGAGVCHRQPGSRCAAYPEREFQLPQLDARRSREVRRAAPHRIQSSPRTCAPHVYRGEAL